MKKNKKATLTEDEVLDIWFLLSHLVKCIDKLNGRLNYLEAKHGKVL